MIRTLEIFILQEDIQSVSSVFPDQRDMQISLRPTHRIARSIRSFSFQVRQGSAVYVLVDELSGHWLPSGPAVVFERALPKPSAVGCTARLLAELIALEQRTPPITELSARQTDFGLKQGESRKVVPVSTAEGNT